MVLLYDNRVSLLGTTVAGTAKHDGKSAVPTHKVLESALETPIRVVTVIALMILGWAVARDIGRGLGPALFRRLDPATAGTVGFVIRLTTVVLALFVALGWLGSKRKRLLWARRSPR